MPTNIPVFDVVDTLFNDSILLSVVNSSITCTSVYEQNRKAVNAVYGNSWVKGIEEFSAADSATLYTVAMENPLYGGSAVYSARVMLRMEVDEVNTASSQRMANPEPENNTVVISQARMYPNPTSEQITVETLVKEGESASLEIYDLAGQLVLKQDISNASVNTVSIAKLNAGTYICRVTVNDEVALNERLVIVK